MLVEACCTMWSRHYFPWVALWLAWSPNPFDGQMGTLSTLWLNLLAEISKGIKGSRGELDWARLIVIMWALLPFSSFSWPIEDLQNKMQFCPSSVHQSFSLAIGFGSRLTFLCLHKCNLFTAGLYTYSPTLQSCNPGNNELEPTFYTAKSTVVQMRKSRWLLAQNAFIYFQFFY